MRVIFASLLLLILCSCSVLRAAAPSLIDTATRIVEAELADARDQREADRIREELAILREAREAERSAIAAEQRAQEAADRAENAAALAETHAAAVLRASVASSLRRAVMMRAERVGAEEGPSDAETGQPRP